MNKRTWVQVLVLAGCMACTSAHAPMSGSYPSLAAPELALLDLAGQTRPLSDFLGRVVLLEFFATWCEPCKTSLATYSEWQREYGDEGLVVIAVSLDEKGSPVTDFAERYAPDLLLLLDPNAVCASFLDLRGLPAAYLFDRAGTLVSHHVGAASGSLKDEVARLLPRD